MRRERLLLVLLEGGRLGGLGFLVSRLSDTDSVPGLFDQVSSPLETRSSTSARTSSESRDAAARTASACSGRINLFCSMLILSGFGKTRDKSMNEQPPFSKNKSKGLHNVYSLLKSQRKTRVKVRSEERRVGKE